MIQQRVGVLMLVLFLATAAGPASARTWHVPTEAPTIAAAIDSAISGDVVEISGGTYLYRLVSGPHRAIGAAVLLK